MHRSAIVSLFLLAPAGAAFLPAADREPRPYNPHVAKASKQGLDAIKRMQAPPGLRIDLWAAEPMLANPVIFCIDHKNRFYVAETFRLHAGVTDIRGHMDWLDDDLACRTVEDRIAMLKRKLGKDVAKYGLEHERIRLLEDTKGAGVADRSVVFADGFNRIEDGIAAGLLARGGDVWYACLPDLWLLRDTKGKGGEVGPDLTGIGSRQKRDYLLESIVEPNKQIAKGFETVVLTLNNGPSRSGVLKKEDARSVHLMSLEGKLLIVPKASIEDRQTGKSSMPEDVVKYLSRSEVRDLVEFLASLKEPAKKP